MRPGRAEELALRREALAARASLQRLELTAAVDRLRARSAGVRGVGALALRAAAAFAGPRPGGDSLGTRARPWMLSAAVLLLRVLRSSPTARGLVGVAALGGAVWWVARSLRAPDQPPADQPAADQPDADQPPDDGG